MQQITFVINGPFLLTSIKLKQKSYMYVGVIDLKMPFVKIHVSNKKMCLEPLRIK